MIVRLNGGLANQMFQYAFGRSVAKVRGEQVFFKTQDLGHGCHRFYGLGAFKTDVNLINDPGGAPYYGEPRFRFDPGVYTAPQGSYFQGCWQTEKYFDEPLVRGELTLRNPVSPETQRVAGDIQSVPQTAFVHVRRTDYLLPHAARHHGNMGMDYYNNAMQYIRERVENVRFYIFSDDPSWCRANFPNERVIGHNGMGSGTKGPSAEHEDLYLMGLCKHAIIPNSSFGWFGAWFGDAAPNRPRIVIGPQKWFALTSLESCDIMPERWIKL
jgi:hypothetical protein